MGIRFRETDSIRALNSVNETPRVVVAAIFQELRENKDFGSTEIDKLKTKNESRSFGFLYRCRSRWGSFWRLSWMRRESELNRCPWSYNCRIKPIDNFWWCCPQNWSSWWLVKREMWDVSIRIAIYRRWCLARWYHSPDYVIYAANTPMSLLFIFSLHLAITFRLYLDI